MSKVIQMPTGKNTKPKSKQGKSTQPTHIDPKVDLLQHMALMIQYWNGIDDPRLTQHDRLVGLTMSILEAIDGHGFELPQYHLAIKGTDENIAGKLGMLFPLVYEVVAKQVMEALAEVEDDEDED